MIVAYKFGIQKGGALSPAEGIKVHFLHAAANEGKVLLTMGRFPSAEYRDDINQVILTTRSGNYAVIGDVEDLSKMDLFAPPEGYTVPSIWNDETSEEVTGWFALKNLREIKINPGDLHQHQEKIFWIVLIQELIWFIVKKPQNRRIIHMSVRSDIWKYELY